jgi:dUTP pyrophosphatase
MDLYFAKLKPEAIIPSKDDENAGYDIYGCFDDDYIEIQPGEISIIPSGIATAVPEGYYMQVNERSSSGSKGLSLRCGVVDSGYRGELFIAINNTTNKRIVICKDEFTDKFDPDKDTIWPYGKALVQGVILPVPQMQVKEISYEELKNIKSKRGDTAFGASGK